MTRFQTKFACQVGFSSVRRELVWLVSDRLSLVTADGIANIVKRQTISFTLNGTERKEIIGLM